MKRATVLDELAAAAVRRAEELRSRTDLDILSGEETGAARDVVLLNAGAAIHVSGTATTIEEGVSLARESISGGSAAKALEDFIKATRRLSGTA